MLTLQRASAGSGKTYTLARTFIRHLLTEQHEGKTTLRNEESLPDAVSHILAVTFTNKATNEMKQRIIDKLHALTRLDVPESKVDYLQDFMKEFGVSREEIAERSRLALKYLLLDYSNFNVSTIDSFFQNILRTFAYEAELPDGYKLEIDTDYVSAVGVDTLVQDLMTDNMDDESRYWLDLMVKNAMAEDRDYNIVNKRESGKQKFGYNNKKTLYTVLKDSAKLIDKEDFKEFMPMLENYISSGHRLSEAYQEINGHYLPAIEHAFDDLRDKASTLLRLYSRYAPKGVTNIGRDKAIERLRSMTSRYADPTGEYSWEELTGRKSALSRDGQKNLTPAQRDEVEAAYNDVTEAYQKWVRTLYQPGWDVWNPIRKIMPETALIYQFKENIMSFLELNNTMVLADTNTILSNIIEDGEVPFIYERLSTHIHHFLIDEFQDTSKMQWENFKPLLKESMAHGYDNLIIGDAKQSIYRFRNADPSIISEKVPSTFRPETMNVCGESLEQNSNWRSDLRIVQFNNYIFRRFHDDYTHLLGDLYAGATQQPRKSSARGYVEWVPYSEKEMNISSGESKEDESLTTNISSQSDAVVAVKKSDDNDEKYKVIGPMIHEMLSRGYRQKDIAILCNANTTGEAVIAKLMEYNNSLGDNDEQLRFVSEQSLKLGSNRAVRVVISALRSLADGIYYATDEDEREAEETKVDWRDIATQFILYSNAHADISLGDRINNFLNDARHDDTLSEMVSRMQATTLPALVEAIIDMFLHGSQPGGGKEEDTAFLTALQDAVIDYSNIYVADIASFLDWWDKKGEKLSISSPEDTDAINIMTVHKSKGLEFECVILPDIEISLEPKHGSWKWAQIPRDFTYGHLLPEYMPVMVNNDLVKAPDGSYSPGPYASLWDDECRLTLTDNLNKAYVAFTRAVSELYILSGGYKTPKSSNKPVADEDHIKNKLAKYLKVDIVSMSDTDGGGDNVYLNVDELREPTEFCGIYYGEKPTAEDVHERITKRIRDERRDVRTAEIKGYFVNADQSMLHLMEEDDRLPKEEDEDTIDPRSEGTLIHTILEHTRTYSDLGGAITRMRLRGLLTSQEAAQMEQMLREALEATRGTHWFDGTLRVINERPVYAPGYRTYRADRLLVTPEGKAIVVDYKTGTSEHNSAHHRQVRRYMGLMMETGEFTGVEGWLWYVKEGKIERVNLDNR